ncbi:hypothetical protein NN561_008507 [Cricetulus griseus]
MDILQDWPLHALQQFIDGVGIGMGQLKVLDLGLGGSSVDQPSHATPTELFCAHITTGTIVGGQGTGDIKTLDSRVVREATRGAFPPPPNSLTTWCHSAADNSVSRLSQEQSRALSPESMRWTYTPSRCQTLGRPHFSISGNARWLPLGVGEEGRDGPEE